MKRKRSLQSLLPVLLCAALLLPCACTRETPLDPGTEVDVSSLLTYGNNPYYTYEGGMRLPPSLLDLPTDQLVETLGDIRIAKMESMLSSRIPEPSPDPTVSAEDVERELYSRADAQTELLNHYMNYTGSLLKLSDERKQELAAAGNGWRIRLLAQIDALRQAISDQYAEKLTKTEAKTLFERDQAYQAFRCRYVYNYAEPLQEAARTTDFDPACLEYLKEADCSAFALPFSWKDAEKSEEELRALSTKDLVRAGADRVRIYWGNEAKPGFTYNDECAAVALVIGLFNERSDLAKEYLAYLEELVRLHPYASTQTEYDNLFYTLQALRVTWDQSGSSAGSILKNFTEAEQKNLLELLRKDWIQSSFRTPNSNQQDLLYRLYFRIHG